MGKNNLSKYGGNYKTSSNYDGLGIHAAVGLHEEMIKIILKNFKKISKILILGSGTGSFDKRMFDNGFKNITSSDINIKNYKYKNKEVRFFNLDLNKEFNKILKEKFDLIIAMELIEHLFSPFNFLKRCSSILKKNGKILISTPNLHNSYSRLNFLITGYPSYFITKPDKFDHVSPIFHNILEHYCDLLNLKIKKKYGVLNFFQDFKFYSFKSYVYYIFMRFAGLFLNIFMIQNRNLLKGIVSVYIIKKDEY